MGLLRRVLFGFIVITRISKSHHKPQAGDKPYRNFISVNRLLPHLDSGRTMKGCPEIDGDWALNVAAKLVHAPSFIVNRQVDGVRHGTGYFLD